MISVGKTRNPGETGLHSLQRLVACAWYLRGRFATLMRDYRAMRQLEEMSDEQLFDIGLTRADLDRVGDAGLGSDATARLACMAADRIGAEMISRRSA